MSFGGASGGWGGMIRLHGALPGTYDRSDLPCIAIGGHRRRIISLHLSILDCCTVSMIFHTSRQA